MTDDDRRLVARDDDGKAIEVHPVDMRLWVQAHRAAAQAAVATALGARVLSLELREGPPPVGEVHLDQPGSSDPGPQEQGRVRLLAYTIAGPIAERVAEQGIPLQGEPAYHLATTVLETMRQEGQIDEQTDRGAIARLLLDHFGECIDDAAEATEHLALNVETWVCQHWGAIAVVAANLLQHRRLSGDGVRQLMPPLQADLLT